MPPTGYAIALALGMVGAGLALAIFSARRRMKGAPRRVATALWASWTLVGVGAEVWAFMSPTYYPIMSAAAWMLVGMLFGLRLRRAGRRARLPAAGAGEGKREGKRGSKGESEDESKGESKRPSGFDAPLPPGAEEALERRGVAGEDVIASLAADVSPDGSYAEWRLVATKARLVSLALVDGRDGRDARDARDGRVEADEAASTRAAPAAPDTDGAWEVVAEVPVDEIEDLRAESLVGGGRLAVSRSTRPGPPDVLAHYSNAHSRAFMGFAKAVNDHVAARKKAAEEGEEGEQGKGEEGESGEGDGDGRPPELTFEELDDKDRKTCPTCGRPLRHGSLVCSRCLKRGRVILRLLKLSGRYWVQILILSVLMVVGTAVGLAEPRLFKELVDEVLSSEVVKGERPASVFGLYEGEPATALVIVVLAYVGVLLLGVAIGIVRSRLMAEVGARVGMDLRARVFHHLQALSLGYFDRQKTGALMSRTDHDTGRVQQFLIEGVQFTVISVLEVIGIMVILFVMDWRLATWALLPTPLMVAFSAVFWRFIIGMFRRLWERVSRLSAFLNDSISGVRVVKSFGQEEREKERFDEHNFALYQGIARVGKTFATFMPLLTVVMASGGILVRYVAGMGVISGEITLGTLLAFGIYLWRLYRPLQMLTRLNDWLTRSLTAAERVFEVLDNEPEVKDAEDAVPMPSIEGRIEVKGVTFGYDKLKPVLKNVSFEVAPGEMIGFVGHSGAGKTTTINLLSRLYDVDEGAVLIDGIDVRKLRLSDLRRQTGVVLQETYLFSGSVAENIAYADPDASREDVMEAAAAANAHGFIMKLPSGYDSEVGERGKRLSVGEKQRIAIARAILHNPKILILDEATSSVDTETEKQIQAALGRLVKNRTTFAIAHRLSTLRNADRLVVLKDGEIDEIGTHEELIEKRGTYHKLVEAQSEMTRAIAVGG